MRKRALRSRPTRELVDAAQERFWGCDVCRSDDAYDFIDDVVRPLNLLKRERVRLLRSLTCPACESSIQSGTFVVGADPRELRRLALSKRFDRLHKQQLLDFREFLSHHPMLGATNPFGQQLAKAMSRARRTRLEKIRWFHATRDLSNSTPGPRPRERTTRANRFNQIGQPAWYLGTDERTAAVEMLREPKPRVPLAIAKVEITEPVSVLDLRLPFPYGDDNPTRSWILREVVARRFVSEPTGDVDESRPQYRVPQYVADLARKHGFRGILYDSTRPSAYNNPEAWGMNLVLFDPFPRCEIKPAKVMEFGEPNYEVFSLERWPLVPVQLDQTPRCPQSQSTVSKASP
jgi:RES domain